MVMNDKERAIYWEQQSNRHQDAAEYYREELAKSHELLGRVVHQLSERWDSLNVTRYFPTDNLFRKRSVGNPTGKADTNG